MPDTIRRVFDTKGTSDVLYGSPDIDRFIMTRDQRYDEIRWFTDGVDQINLWSYDITFDSLLVVRVSLQVYKVFVRDEVMTVKFNRPPSAEIPEDGVLLDASDFIFKTGLPDPPVQVRLEQETEATEVLVGTTLPDEFVFTFDGQVDIVNRYELHKDRIDLSGYATSFDDLEFVDRAPGKITIWIQTDEGVDRLKVNEPSKRFTSDDFTPEDFIF